MSRAVKVGKDLISKGETDGEEVLKQMKAIIEAEPMARIDYVEMVAWDSIEVHHQVDGSVLVAMAVYIGKTRLIDNFIWE